MKIVFGWVVPFGIVCLMMLSAYIEVGASAQYSNIGDLPLRIYHLNEAGKLAVAPKTGLSSGEPVWLGLPERSTVPYWLTVASASGSDIWTDYGSSLPSNSLLPLKLNPSRFPTGQIYDMTLQILVENAPGILVVRTLRAQFLLMPGFGKLLKENFSRSKGFDSVQLGLMDSNNNPKVGVRLGLFLEEGQSSTFVLSGLTDQEGNADLQFAESLASGRYHLTAKVLDSNAVFAQQLNLDDFQVEPIPTQVSVKEDFGGLIHAKLFDPTIGKPVEGRLLILEQKLADGNWSLVSSAYTGSQGESLFSKPRREWRVSFEGDIFYKAANSDNPEQTFSANLTKTGDSMISPSVYCEGPSAHHHIISPACGGEIPPTPTNTALFAPNSLYATVPTTLAAQVTWDPWGTTVPAPVGNVTFYLSKIAIGWSLTNSSGYASMLWTPKIIGSVVLNATYVSANGSPMPSASPQKTVTISSVPTVVMLLKPQPIAYAWDVTYPIAIPVVTLTRSNAGTGLPADIYMPSYNGSSTAPAAPPTGYAWTGLNQTLVSLSFDQGYTLTQMLNWTRTFYLPSCPNFSSSYDCTLSSMSRTGTISLSANLYPPSNLYTANSATLNIPYQTVGGVFSGSSSLTLDTTPPAHLYVNVSSTYPFLTVKMQTLPVALANYTYSIAQTLGPPPAPSVSSGYSVYQIPYPISYVYVCTNASCNAPAASVNVDFLNPSGQWCFTVVTDAQGVASVPSIFGCSSYQSARIYTAGNTLTLAELFKTEHSGRFITNFQGYGFDTYAPLRTGRYLIQAKDDAFNCWFTTLYPLTTYPDVQCYLAHTTDRFVNIEKHPTSGSIGLNPGAPTILDYANATVQLSDLATLGALGLTSFNYQLVQTDPAASTVLSGSASTNINGTYALDMGQLQYGNYTLTVTTSGNAALNPLSTSFSFTVYKAKPLLALTAYQSTGQPGYADSSRVNTATTSLQFGTGPVYLLRGLAQSFKIQGSSPMILLNASFDVQECSSGCGGSGVFMGNLYLGSNQADMTASLPTGPVLTQSQHVDESSFPTTAGLFTFIFGPTSYLLQPNTVYEITLQEIVLTTNTHVWIDASSHNRKGGSYLCSSTWTFTDCSSAGLGTTPIAPPFYVGTVTASLSSTSWITAYPNHAYLLRSTLVNNRTQTPISVSGLSETATLNSAPFASMSTDPAGNTSLLWRPTAIGTYRFNLQFPRQNYYTNSSVTALTSVQKLNAVLAVTSSPPSPINGTQVSWNVQAYDMVDSYSVKRLSVKMYTDGVLNSTVNTDSNGVASFSVAGFKNSGPHNVTFYSPGNNTYNPVSSYNPLQVYVNTTLALRTATIIVGQSNTVSFSLNYSSGGGISGRTVRIETDNSFYQNVTTNYKGQGNFTWRPDTTGTHTITARYLATSAGDFGLKPATSSLSVNVQAQTITNAQGAQSLTFGTAQGKTQLSGLPAVSFQFSLSSITATVNYNGKTAQASSHLWNEFGWSGFLPFWKIHIDTGVSGVFDMHFADQIFGGATASVAITQPQSVDEDAFNVGLGASAASAGAGLVALFAQGGPLDPEAPEGAGVVVILGTIVAMSVGINLVSNSSVSRRSYLWGFILPIALGLLCAIGLPCPEPESFPVLHTFLFAIGLWASYYVSGILLSWPLAALVLLFLLFLASYFAVILTLT